MNYYYVYIITSVSICTVGPRESDILFLLYVMHVQHLSTAVAEAKQRVWEEFGEAMEKDFRTAPRRFWNTVRHLQEG